jgi:hypothetical protein
MAGIETCDDGGKGGCNDDCSSESTFFNCSGGNTTSPTICNCFSGRKYNPSTKNCPPECGDGKVLAPEKCDDKGEGGCLKDCSGANEDFECTGGTP